MSEQPDLTVIQAERARLGSLAWAQGGPVGLDKQITPALLDWLVSDTRDAPADVLEEAVALEYAADTGHRTDAGADARVALTKSPSLRIVERSAAGPRSLVVGVDGGMALLVESSVDGATTIGYLTSDEVPQFVAGWLPLEPVWNADIGGLTVSNDEIDGVLAGAQAGATGNDILDALLASRWSLWAVDAGESFVEFATVEGWGVMALDRDAAGVSLHPVASGDVLLTLIESLAVQIWQ